MDKIKYPQPVDLMPFSRDNSNPSALYGLPTNVVYCKKCVISNQRLNSAHRIADRFYGGHRVSAVIGRNQITGCQFHFEKSGEAGLKILRKFCVD